MFSWLTGEVQGVIIEGHEFESVWHPFLFSRTGHYESDVLFFSFFFFFFFLHSSKVLTFNFKKILRRVSKKT